MRRLTEAEMKEIELEILDEVHRICEAHGLRYFLAYGSLIGAMRHQGFIPWDDDMDLLMFRADYAQLVAHFDEWKSDDRFGLMAPELGNCPYQFAKVYDTHTLMKQTYTRDEYTTGVWVDIFALDWFDPKNQTTLRRIRALSMIRYLAAANLSAPSKTPLLTKAKRLVGRVLSKADPKLIAKRIDELAQAQCTTPSQSIALMYDVDKEMRYVYLKEWFEPVLVPFEDRQYYAPRDYEPVLAVRYGNWKEPVPEESHSPEAYLL